MADMGFPRGPTSKVDLLEIAVKLLDIFLLGRGAARFLAVLATLLNFQSMAATPTISVGLNHTCALLSTGSVQCWGYNFYGTLGIEGTPFRLVPTDVRGITNAIAISAGAEYSCAVLNGGSVQCWGFNGFGQLGNGTTTNSSVPVTVTGIDSAISVSVGFASACAVLNNGTVRCWGYNTAGQLGNGTTTNSPIPVPVVGVNSAVSVSVGSGSVCALLSTGEVQCWGSNSFGQLGNGVAIDSGIPVRVNGIENATAVAVGTGFTCALLSSGVVKCWGYSGDGGLGNPSYFYTRELVPVLVSGISDGVSISANGVTVCAVLGNGTVQCWGSIEFGIGKTQTSYLPVSVIGINSAKTVSVGSKHTCVVVASGEAQCLGFNLWGQIGNGSNVNAPSPVFVMGANSTGQLNLGATSGANLAIDADKVFAWAERSYVQVFSPAGQASQSLPGYRYRSYAGGHFLAVNDSGTPHLYYLGPLSGSAVLDLGVLTTWLSQAGP